MADQPNKATSLRNPLAALARANEAMALVEKKPLPRMQMQAEAKRLRALAEKQPKPGSRQAKS